MLEIVILASGSGIGRPLGNPVQIGVQTSVESLPEANCKHDILLKFHSVLNDPY